MKWIKELKKEWLSMTPIEQILGTLIGVIIVLIIVSSFYGEPNTKQSVVPIPLILPRG